jgi:hypothetical protein
MKYFKKQLDIAYLVKSMLTVAMPMVALVETAEKVA